MSEIQYNTSNSEIQYNTSNNEMIFFATYERSLEKVIRARMNDVKKYEEMSHMERELCTSGALKRSMRLGLNDVELGMMDERKMKDIKEEAMRNYVVPEKIGNKSWKKTWIKALIGTQKWALNAFMVGVKSNKKHLLNGQIDVLLMIQEFM